MFDWSVVRSSPPIFVLPRGYGYTNTINLGAVVRRPCSISKSLNVILCVVASYSNKYVAYTCTVV